MTLRRAFIWLWVGGLALFAIVIALGMPLVLTAVPGGILDHQAAGTAQEADRIQAAWRAAGQAGQARVAMIADLAFIGVYGAGCILGGIYFRQKREGWARGLGLAALFAGAVFVATDYAETTAQFIQLIRFEGDNGLAGLAAQVRPVKIASWIAATLAIAAGLIAEWKVRRRS